MPSRLRRNLIVMFVGLFVLVVLADWWIGLPDAVTSTYVGRSACAECHAEQTRRWIGSDHDRAMDLATPEAVLGDFNDQSFTYQGITSRMFTRDDDYYIHTEGSDGRMQDFKISHTFGVRPLQQYMVKFSDGRLQVLRVSWDTERRQWFYVPPPDVVDEKIEPEDPLHWTGIAQNWNHMCAECHSTDFHKNYDLESDSYKSTFSEIDVSCEACHGPGSTHVELAEAKSLFWDRKHGYGLPRMKTTPVAMPFDARPLSATKTELETCAVCHSRRSTVHPDFRPGSELLDHYEPRLLDEGLYHADGQILDEVYVYGSFLQSKMYHNGVTCSDCHDPHSLELRYTGNQLCSQCHQAGKYDGPTHHHHEPGSRGAACVECHMPSSTYMVVDVRRDHSMRSPRPDLSATLGIPNACNACHDKPNENADWAAETVRKWYGAESRNRLDDNLDYSHAIWAARQGHQEAEPLLLKILSHRDTPDIVRATAISLLSQYPSDKSVAARVSALDDENPLIRLAAVRWVTQLDALQWIEQLSPLLSDPVRSVRSAAAWRLAGLPGRLFTGQQFEAYERSIQEYINHQLVNNDRMAAHLNLGNLYQRLGNPNRAVRSYRTAIRVEPYLAGPRSALATFLENQGGNTLEIQRYREQELDLLDRDVRLMPENGLARYRFGLTLYLLGKMDQAEQQLVAACRLEPDSYDYRRFLTLLYEKRAKWSQALRSAKQLTVLRPDDPTTLQIYNRIQQAAALGTSE